MRETFDINLTSENDIEYKTKILVSKVIDMEEVKTTEKNVDVLFSKLDEGLEDLENGRVISEEDMWAELTAMDGEA